MVTNAKARRARLKAILPTILKGKQRKHRDGAELKVQPVRGRGGYYCSDDDEEQEADRVLLTQFDVLDTEDALDTLAHPGYSEEDDDEEHSWARTRKYWTTEVLAA